MTAFRIQSVDHRDPFIAQELHAIHMAAYAQEAKLLSFPNVSDFPPMQQTIADLQHSGAQFVAASESASNERMIGAASVEPAGVATWSGEPLNILSVFHIASLVVLPAYQRRGIGRMLIRYILDSCSPAPITVSTDVRNVPAIQLYKQLNFKRVRQRTIRCGSQPFELVLLLRTT